jgi:hypothetical protein
VRSAQSASRVQKFRARLFANRIFGSEPVETTVLVVQSHLDAMGHATVLGRPGMRGALVDLMLLAGSPLLDDLGDRGDLLAELRGRERNNARYHGVEQLARTLVEMGVLPALPFTAVSSREEWLARSQAGEIDVPAEWLAWTRRWFETSTLSPRSRKTTYYSLIKAGAGCRGRIPTASTRAAGIGSSPLSGSLRSTG